VRRPGLAARAMIATAMIALTAIASTMIAPVGAALAQKAPSAQPTPPSPPSPPKVIAVAPLTMLGAEDTTSTARRFEGQVGAELGKLVAGAKVISAADVIEATKKAKKPALRACDGEAACLSELGALVGAELVVFGEVGGLGDVQVLALGAIDVAAKAERRRVRVSMAQPEEGGVAGAVTRLLDPERFVGQLALTVSVDGASIYIDGKRHGKSPTPVVRLSVGPHALRVTHPEHRDYVRFIDIGFGQRTPVDVKLEKFAAVESAVSSTATPTPTGPVRYVDRPARWYRRWWAVAGVTVLAVGAGVAIGAAIDYQLDADREGQVDPP